MLLSRRTFCTQSALLAAATALPALPPTSRPDVAAIDRDRILSAAARYVLQPPDPITAHQAPNTPGTSHDFYSEDTTNWPDDPQPSPKSTPLFTAHRQAILDLSLAVPALTAAHLLLRTSDPTQSNTYATKAAAHLRAWFISPETRMAPSLNYGLIDPRHPTTPRPEGIVETVQLVEVAQSIPFLLEANVLSAPETTTLLAWFADYLTWLTTSRLALLARDRKDHLATAWLLQCAAFGAIQPTPAKPVAIDPLDLLRHQFKSVTIRSQVQADGTFPHELTTPWPYRLSLFNLDMLAAICQLLSTRFESLWTFELPDGPSMRAAIARHVPYIQNRSTWPYPADATLFTALPLRHPSLLFAARAYERPEYATLWRTLPPDPTNPTLLRTFPIRQPLLWVTRPKP